MEQPLIRSLDELERLARDRLATGDDPGRVQVRLAIDEGDLICVEVRSDDGTASSTACLFNGYPVRSRAVELVLAIHGATLLDPAAGSRRSITEDREAGHP